MLRPRRTLALALAAGGLLGAPLGAQEPAAPLPTVAATPDRGFETVEFPSLDGLPITADLYVGELTEGARREHRPFIVLFHQAGWSRGEYREIAPQLVLLGFDCLAVDQRSGGAVGDVVNATHARAIAAEQDTRFTDAEQDLVAALAWARRAHANGRTLVAWGSSYSAALVLRVAALRPELVDAWLAFSPGDYFVAEGQPKDWIATAALSVHQPGFVTSARRERGEWEELWDNLPTVPNEARWYFLPKSAGNHGSRALWARHVDSGDYWRAVEAFLDHVWSLERPAPMTFEESEPTEPDGDGGDGRTSGDGS